MPGTHSKPKPRKPKPRPKRVPLEPPEHWSKEDQDLFLEQPAKVQQYLLDRSKAMEAAHTQRSQEIAPLRNVVGQWDGYLKQIQADPAQMFHSLLGFEYQLRSGTNEQKIQTLMQLAQAYGVEFAQQQAEPSAEEDPFGIQKQIAAAVDPIKQQLGQVSGGFQQQNQQTQQAEQARLQQQVRDFADEKGADGKLAHPYFSEVRQDMAALAQAKAAAGQPQDIAELYETACWSNPSVRAKMQAAAERKAEATKRKAEQERAKKAKRAAGSLSGSGGGGSTEQPKGLREQLEANYDAAAS